MFTQAQLERARKEQRAILDAAKARAAAPNDRHIHEGIAIKKAGELRAKILDCIVSIRTRRALTPLSKDISQLATYLRRFIDVFDTYKTDFPSHFSEDNLNVELDDFTAAIISAMDDVYSKVRVSVEAGRSIEGVKMVQTSLDKLSNVIPNLGPVSVQVEMDCSRDEEIARALERAQLNDDNLHPPLPRNVRRRYR